MNAPGPVDVKRSQLMARVRQKGTSAERKVASLLKRLGLGYRLNVRSLPGSPDFANKRKRWVIFVQGCFWHHHTNCRRATVPKTNRQFWSDKFAANRRRDAKAIRSLRASGYRVMLVWECELVDTNRLVARLSKILEPRRVQMGQPVDH